MSVTASIIVDGIAAMKPEDVRAAGRAALRAVGRHWINVVLPQHFTPAGATKYHYAPRSAHYRFRKRNRRIASDGARAIGEDKPLVWSGRSRERAKAARFQLENSTGTSVAGSVIINAPALNFMPRGGTINLREEVTRITQAELNELADIFTNELEKQLVKRGKSARRVLKVA